MNVQLSYDICEMFIFTFTEESMDYIQFSRILSFAACETRRCVNITIVDDLVDEPVEEFDVTLERTLHLESRIRLQPMDAMVIINDDEGKNNKHCTKN